MKNVDFFKDFNLKMKMLKNVNIFQDFNIEMLTMGTISKSLED